MSTALESWSPLYLYTHAENDSFFLFFFFFYQRIADILSTSYFCPLYPSPALLRHSIQQ